MQNTQLNKTTGHNSRKRELWAIVVALAFVSTFIIPALQSAGGESGGWLISLVASVVLLVVVFRMAWIWFVDATEGRKTQKRV